MNSQHEGLVSRPLWLCLSPDGRWGQREIAFELDALKSTKDVDSIRSFDGHLATSLVGTGLTMELILGMDL